MVLNKKTAQNEPIISFYEIEKLSGTNNVSLMDNLIR